MPGEEERERILDENGNELYELDPSQIPDGGFSTEQAIFLKSLAGETSVVDGVPVLSDDRFIEKRVRVIGEAPYVVPLVPDGGKNVKA